MPKGIYKRKPFSEKQRKQSIKNLGEGMNGKHHSKETKRKIGLANSISQKGKKLSEEHKRKISEVMKGKLKGENNPAKRPEVRKKMSEARKGQKLSKETRKKMSESHQGLKSYSWKGGITPENKKIRNGIEIRLWRESVFACDNWTCQKYGIKGGKLHSHHIENFSQHPELRFAIDNGITLSKKAHDLFHKIYGKKNNTKEQIKGFLL